MKIEDVLAHYRPPFTRVMSGYVMDADGRPVAQARGYGHLQNCVDGKACDAVDALAEFIADALNGNVGYAERNGHWITAEQPEEGQKALIELSDGRRALCMRYCDVIVTLAGTPMEHFARVDQVARWCPLERVIELIGG